MTRLPQPGSDNGQWGQILNDYLSQAHKTDGTLKDNIITAAHIAPSAVNITALGGSGVADGSILMVDSGSPAGFVWAAAGPGGPVSVVTMAGDVTGQSNASVISDGAITTVKLDDGAVTTVKLADASVTSQKLAAGAVGAGAIADSSITQPKFDTPAAPTAGQVLGWDGAQLAWTAAPVGGGGGGASSVSGDVSGTLSGTDIATTIAASAVTTAKLSDNSVTAAKLANSAVDTLAILDNNVTEPKLKISNTPAINNFLSWNGTDMTWAPSSLTSASLDDLTNVNASTPTNGQVLSFNAAGTEWVPSTVVSTVVSDATTSAKGIVQLTGDLAGTASAPTVPGLASKAASARQIATSGSLSGGGNLTADRTLSLVNDSVAPGASKYYGTDGAGAKGYFTLPAGGGGGGATSLSGDVTGTLSGSVIAATIANLAVTTAKLAAGAVTPAKISSTGAGVGNVLSYNGTAVVWSAPTPAGGASWNIRNTTTSATAANGDWLLANPSAGTITITLPAATLGARVRVKRKASAGSSIIVAPSGGAQIDLGEPTSTTVNGGFACIEYEADGTNWWAVGGF